MIYLYAVPKVFKQYQGLANGVRTVHLDHTVDIPEHALVDDFVYCLPTLIPGLAGRATPKRGPDPANADFATSPPQTARYVCTNSPTYPKARRTIFNPVHSQKTTMDAINHPLRRLGITRHRQRDGPLRDLGVGLSQRHHQTGL